MKIVTASGKGGTGKTTLVASFAELMKNKVVTDNDVDASNLHLLLTPETYKRQNFIGGKTYFIDQKICISCGVCEDACRFDAVKILSGQLGLEYKIDKLSCEGCGLCDEVCPEKAISSRESINGQWFQSITKHGLMSHAKLGIGEENSGKLVTQVRNNASKMAEECNADYILSDGPPGTGCLVISSVTDVDLVLIVTEPTVSGVHDMTRILELTNFFHLKTLVVINKFDLSIEQTKNITALSNKYNAKIIGKIPFDKNVNNALTEGKTVVSYKNSKAPEAIKEIYNEFILKLIHLDKTR